MENYLSTIVSTFMQDAHAHEYIPLPGSISDEDRMVQPRRHISKPPFLFLLHIQDLRVEFSQPGQEVHLVRSHVQARPAAGLDLPECVEGDGNGRGQEGLEEGFGIGVFADGLCVREMRLVVIDPFGMASPGGMNLRRGKRRMSRVVLSR